MAGTMCYCHLAFWYQSDQFAKVPYQARISMKPCRSVLDVYSSIADALELSNLIIIILYDGLQSVVLNLLPTLK